MLGNSRLHEARNSSNVILTIAACIRQLSHVPSMALPLRTRTFPDNPGHFYRKILQENRQNAVCIAADAIPIVTSSWTCAYIIVVSIFE